MNIRLFLADGVEDLNGFTIDSQAPSLAHVTGCKLRLRDGCWQYEFDDPDYPVPEFLLPCIRHVSIRAFAVRREVGVYELRTAVARVDWQNVNDRQVVLIHIISSDLADARNLLFQIQSGGMRPNHSYEGPQTGKSYAELEAKIAELEHANCLLRAEAAGRSHEQRLAEEERATLRAEIDILKTQLRRKTEEYDELCRTNLRLRQIEVRVGALRAELCTKRWWWVWRKRVIERLGEILLPDRVG